SKALRQFLDGRMDTALDALSVSQYGGCDVEVGCRRKDKRVSAGVEKDPRAVRRKPGKPVRSKHTRIGEVEQRAWVLGQRREPRHIRGVFQVGYGKERDPPFGVDSY